MRKCEMEEQKLSDYLDKALPADELLKVEEHLKGCPDCRKVLNELKSTVKLAWRYGKLRGKAPSEERTMAMLRARVNTPARPRILFLRPYAWGLVSGAVAALLIFILSFNTGAAGKENTVSLAAGQIVAALIGSDPSAEGYVDSNSILISGGAMLEEKQFLEHFKKIRGKTRSLTIIVADSPAELFRKERELLKYTPAYEYLRSLRLEEIFVGMDIAKKNELTYVSVFIDGDGSFTFAFSGKGNSRKIRYYLEEA